MKSNSDFLKATKAASKTLSFSSTLGNGPVAFNSEATSFTLTGSTAGAGLVIGALEDDDDNDDTTTGNCDWVLSFRAKPTVKRLFFNPAATTSAPLRPLTEARAKRELEKMLLHKHFAQLLHLSEIRKSHHCLLPEKLLLLLLLQLCAALLLQQSQNSNPN